LAGRRVAGFKDPGDRLLFTQLLNFYQCFVLATADGPSPVRLSLLSRLSCRTTPFHPEARLR
jgi:hypothetical protein